MLLYPLSILQLDYELEISMKSRASNLIVLVESAKKLELRAI